MTISRDTAQDAYGTASTTSLNVNYPSTCTLNRRLIALASYSDQKNTITTPSGWTKVIDVEHNSQTFSLALFEKLSAGNETAVTFAKSGSAGQIRAEIYQYSGIVTTATSSDKTATTEGNGVTSTSTGTTATTTQADELIIAVVSINNAGTDIVWTNGTELHDDQLLSSSQRIVSSTGTYSDTATWTGSASRCALIATFKAAAAVTTKNLGLLGVG